MRRPLLVTADPVLLDDLLRLTAAAGSEAEVASDGASARRRWADASVVVVDARLAGALADPPPPRRDGVVLVCDDLDDSAVWQRGVAVGAERVVVLPDAEGALVDLLRAVDPAQAQCQVVGVVGGRGGAGATALAVALAGAGARAGRRTLLADADPLGGGIELVLGAEDRAACAAAAAGWPVRPEDDLAAAPVVDGIHVAVLHPTRDDPAAAPALVRAARRRFDVVVVDLPRSAGLSAPALLGSLDVLLVVVPLETRAVVAAEQVIAAVRPYVDDVRVVLRTGPGSGLTATAVSDVLSTSVGATYRSERAVVSDLDRGVPPGRRTRSPRAGS